MKQIFDILEAQNANYNMKVTFLELCDEEITNLLAPEETLKFKVDTSRKPIALMEDEKGVFLPGAWKKRLFALQMKFTRY